MNFDKVLLSLDINTSEDIKNKFAIYYKELVEWNKVMNLTAITSEEDVYVKHFYDSLCLNKVIDLNNQKILDVGSGAGFPSIPLKIIYPDLKITIIDSLGKRIKFLTNLCDKLNLKDVELIHGRAEEHNKREYYDIVTARAVSKLQILAELCIPFVKINGFFIAMKGSKGKIELADSKKAINLLSGKFIEFIEYSINDEKRSLIKIKKICTTNKKYPRNYGKIKKLPL